jgi:glutathione synthase/RimK-type ligase-like ATP-grasp enzyme
MSRDFDLFLWRACHRPDLRDDAKNKIYFLDIISKKRIFPNWNMYYPYDNKIAQLFLMRRLNIPHPRTFYSRQEEEIENFIKSARYPLIAKCSEGACGDNVKMFSDYKSLKKHVANVFSKRGAPTSFPWVRQKNYVYLQEFLPRGRDMRVIVIGNKVELAFWRKNSSSWIKNVSNGANISTQGILKKDLQIVVDVVKKLKFHWGAFDLMISGEKIYFLEFSSIFGFSQKGTVYCDTFGHRNAHILKKQVEYLHNLLLCKN